MKCAEVSRVISQKFGKKRSREGVEEDKAIESNSYGSGRGKAGGISLSLKREKKETYDIRRWRGSFSCLEEEER